VSASPLSGRRGRVFGLSKRGGARVWRFSKKKTPFLTLAVPRICNLREDEQGNGEGEEGAGRLPSLGRGSHPGPGDDAEGASSEAERVGQLGGASARRGDQRRWLGVPSAP